jgi:transposase InsO family protein
VGPTDVARRALLCAFIDHYSRYVPEGRYYLHEDFAALRFGFRRLLAAYGLMLKLYADNGASFQAHRFHGACKHLGITLVHSKAYVAESRGVIERYYAELATMRSSARARPLQAHRLAPPLRIVRCGLQFRGSPGR